MNPANLPADATPVAAMPAGQTCASTIGQSGQDQTPYFSPSFNQYYCGPAPPPAPPSPGLSSTAWILLGLAAATAGFGLWWYWKQGGLARFGL